MDETYTKVAGLDRYLYRAVDKHGNTVDFLLTIRRMKGSARKSLNKAIMNNGRPRVVHIDKSGGNTSGIKMWNKRSGSVKGIKVRQCKFLNNRVEQDHRSIKRSIAISCGLKEFESGQRTLAGMAVVNMIMKGQIMGSKSSLYYTFRFQIPLSFYSAMSSVSSFYCTRSLSTGISIVRLLTLA